MEPKKRSVGASERDEWLRAAWRVMVGARLDPERLVFVDEMGTNTSLSPIYAWAPKGRRARYSVPRNRGKNTTLLSSMSLSGMGPSRLRWTAPSTVRCSRRSTSSGCSRRLYEPDKYW